MKIALSSYLVFLFVLSGAPAQAIEPFVLLDDFSGDRIDKDIWNGSWRPEGDVLDFAREIKGGELRLMSRTYADSPAPGQRNTTRVRLFPNNSDAITQMLALVRVDAVEINGCTDSATVSNVRGRLSGYFFTTDGPPDPVDATRNVFAAIRLWRRSDSLDPPGMLEVGTQVFVCGDPDCAGPGESLLFEPFGDPIALGQPILLGLIWDPDNDRFIFARTSPLRFATFDYAGILTDVDPPSSDVRFVAKHLEVRPRIENCATGPRASGFMDLFVDGVWVNQSALDP